MISLQQAQENGFKNTTKTEWRAYATELGIEFDESAKSDQLRKQVFNALGIPMSAEGQMAQAPVVTTTNGGSDIFPSYNLTPNGIWGGRRHRIKLPRPEGSKYAQAEPFAWNGKHTYYIPYDEIDAVPEPIYQLLIINKRRRVKQVAPVGGTLGESTTSWEFDDVPHSYYGVDPETERRAGSLMEWYQSRGTEWFHKLTHRQLQQIAAKCEVSQTERVQGAPPRQLSQEELLGRLMEYFFGYADAKADPNDKIES